MTIDNNRRITKNTFLLYFRMLFSTILSLYISRKILDTLGIEDFGIYNVIGGVVIMFGFLNSAMAASSQRFLTIEIAKGDTLRLKQIFSVSVTWHIIIALVVFALSEIVGLWFINTQLNIPDTRLYATNWVFQFSIFTLLLTILNVPFEATLIAHERFDIFAYISILEVMFKLGAVFALQFFHYDKMIFYAILLFIISLILRIITCIYCSKKFDEAQFNFLWDRKLFAVMSSFAGWNLFGVFAGIGYNQGVNILLNIFFGPIVNAARAVTFQIMGAVNQLITNLLTAVQPPITKLYAKNEEENMNSLVFSSSKFSYLILLSIVIPLFVEAETVLIFWLKTVPEYSVIFTRLMLIDILICSFSGPLQILAQATGKVKYYQIFVSSILLFNLPLSYTALKFGFPPQSTFIISIVISIIALIVRLLILRTLTRFPIYAFTKEVLVPAAIITCFIIPGPILIKQFISQGIARLLFVGMFEIIALIIAVWIFGLSNPERQFIKFCISNSIKKLAIK